MRSLGYSIKQAFKQVGRNRMMSFASIFSITAMMLLLGISYIMVVNVNEAAELARADYDTIEVFLLDDVTEEQAQEMAGQLQMDIEGIEKIEFRDKEEALKILQERWGEQGYLLTNLSENPLPNSLVIYVSDLEYANQIATKAAKLDGVEQVKYYRDTVQKLSKITRFIQWAAIVIMLFMVIISMIIVSNTIKLTVFARAKEISIMKYVGATNWFIRGPFFIEGIIIGLISSLISTGIIALIYDRLVAAIGDDVMIMLSASMVPSDFLIFNVTIIFIALGISIGACGSIISMRRFLNV